MPLTTIPGLLLLMYMYLYVNNASAKRTYIANKEAILRLSQANDTKHWNIYIDELLFHVKGVNNIEGWFRISCHVVRHAMQWCQLPDGVGTRSALALHVRKWVPCGSLVWNMNLSPNYKMHTFIAVQVSDQFHITLEFKKVNIESNVHQRNMWRRRKLWSSDQGMVSELNINKYAAIFNGGNLAVIWLSLQ